LRISSDVTELRELPEITKKKKKMSPRSVKCGAYNFVRKNRDLMFCRGERKTEAVPLFPTNYNMRKYTFLFQPYIILVLALRTDIV